MKRAIFLCILAFSVIAVGVPLHMGQAQFVKAPSGQAQTGSFFENAVSIINFLFAIAFLISLIGLVISAIKFIVAGGSEKMIGSAHTTWMASVIGLSIALVGFVIVNIIRYYLR